MTESRESNFAAVETKLSYSFGGEIKIGGNYVSVIRHDNQVFISGQILPVNSVWGSPQSALWRNFVRRSSAISLHNSQ